MSARIIAEFPAHPPLNYEDIRVRLWEFIDLLETKPKTEIEQ